MFCGTELKKGFIPNVTLAKDFVPTVQFFPISYNISLKSSNSSPKNCNRLHLCCRTSPCAPRPYAKKSKGKYKVFTLAAVAKLFVRQAPRKKTKKSVEDYQLCLVTHGRLVPSRFNKGLL